MIRFISVLVLLVGAGVAHAQAGVSGAASGDYQNPKSDAGLCDSKNKDEYYYKNICLTLSESLSKDKCTSDALEKLRQRYLKSIDSNGPPIPDKERFDLGQLSCKSQSGQADWDKVVKNKEVFRTVMMQFFMSVAIAESNLDTFNGLSKTSGVNINHGPRGGIMNLTTDQMDNPKYNKDGCGCKNINSEEPATAMNFFWRMILGESAWAAMSVPGRSPGPRDDHHSIQCGTYMAIVEAAEDGKLFAGNNKAKSNSSGGPPPKPEGAAKIFDTLKEHDGNLPQPQNPNDPDLAVNPKLNMILKKVANYCKKNLDDRGQLRGGTMAEMFGDSGTNLRDTIK